MENIRTKDVQEAAYLWCLEPVDFKDVDVVKRGDKGKPVVYFIFQAELDKQALGQLRTDYYNGNARVEPKNYAQKTVDVRNFLHSALRKLN